MPEHVRPIIISSCEVGDGDKALELFLSMGEDGIAEPSAVDSNIIIHVSAPGLAWRCMPHVLLMAACMTGWLTQCRTALCGVCQHADETIFMDESSIPLVFEKIAQFDAWPDREVYAMGLEECPSVSAAVAATQSQLELSLPSPGAHGVDAHVDSPE